jgi:hypothetical protein
MRSRQPGTHVTGAAMLTIRTMRISLPARVCSTPVSPEVPCVDERQTDADSLADILVALAGARPRVATRMRVTTRLLSLVLVCASMQAAAATTPAMTVTLRFSDAAPGQALPAGWKVYAMSRHHAKARMAIVRDGSDNVFRIDADHASGAIAHMLDVPAATTLRWRWKVDHSIATADLSKKSGDDFAARVYVFFDMPRSRLSWLQRMKLGIASRGLGHPVPTAALCYVWDNRHPVGTVAPNAYTGLVRTIVLQSGNANAGTWQLQQRDLAADFRAAFGRAAPRVTGIALASDTDNTGGQVTAWFGDLTLTPGAAAVPAR